MPPLAPEVGGARRTDPWRGRSPWALRLFLPLGLALVAAGLAVFAVRRGTAPEVVFEQAAAGVAGLAVLAIGVFVRPAWPLSIGLMLGAFSSHWDEMGVPLPLDRLLIITAIVSVVVRERARSNEALRTRPIDWLLALVAIYATGSAILAGTLDDPTARFALLDRLSLLGFVLFFLAPKVYRESRDRQILLGSLVALGAYLGLTALFETTGPEALVFPGYINDPSVGEHIDRARGPFAEAAANGLSLYACLVAAVLAAFTLRQRRWRRVALAVAGLCALGILLTVTRAAWIASAAATIIVLLTVRDARRFLIPVVVTAFVGVIVALAAIPGLESQARGRADDQPPVWDRRNTTSAAGRMLADRPVVGFGWGTFAEESEPYYRQSTDYPLTEVRTIHNVYLSNAVELGLVGAALWLLAMVVAIGGSIRRRGPPALRPWKIGLAALAVCYAVSALSTPLGFALPTLLLWTWAGLVRAEPETA